MKKDRRKIGREERKSEEITVKRRKESKNEKGRPRAIHVKEETI